MLKDKEKDIWVTWICNFVVQSQVYVTNYTGFPTLFIWSHFEISWDVSVVMSTNWMMMLENSHHEMLSLGKICCVENKWNWWIAKQNLFRTADLNEIICLFWNQFGLGFGLHCTETLAASRRSCIHLTKDFCCSYNIHLMTIAISSH